jgi:hypothetical protein
VPTTNMPLEEEDEEGEKIGSRNNGEGKDALLSVSCRLVAKGREQEAETSDKIIIIRCERAPT